MIIVYIVIYLYIIRSAFTYFSVTRGGGGEELSLRFSAFLLHGLFMFYSDE